MDCRLCNVCRRLSRMSLLVAVVFMASLILSPRRVSSKTLPEEECKPRPTIVPVEKSGFRPHHIKLFRCSGTCKDSPPSHRPCWATSRHHITLDLIALTSNEPSTVSVYNETQCGCECALSCTVEEYIDDENCKCIGLGTPAKAIGGKPTSVDVIPYQIGIAVMGFFALCVLIIDMIMCGKDNKGVLYEVKKKCCNSDESKSDQTDNKDVALSNGNWSSSKDNSRRTEV